MAAELRVERNPKFVKKASSDRCLIEEHEIKHPDDTEKFVLRSAITLASGEIILLDRANKNLKLVSANFTCVGVMKFSTYPFDICASNRKANEFYVTEPEVQMIYHVMLKDMMLKTIRSFCIYEECRGITCWKHGLAISVMREGFMGTLGFLDYNCKIKRKVWESDLHTSLFKAPWYLASIRGGRQVVVSDQGNHSVICIAAKTLDVIFIFKSEKLMAPRTLTIDLVDNIYVIGSSESCHNIVQLSPDGKMKAELLSRKDKLHYPSGIAFSAMHSVLLFQKNREIPTICLFPV